LPGYLPDIPGVRVDRAQYLSAVHNGDRAFGRIDQGAAFPMSKQSLYHYATNLNLIVRWPEVATGGKTVAYTMVSIVDVMPSILELLEIPMPAKTDGKSFAGLFENSNTTVRDMIFSGYNYARHGLQVYPMRSAQTRRFQYIYNAWPGELDLKNGRPIVYDGRIDPLGGLCWASMKSVAGRDPALKARVEFIRNRAAEEFYDLDADPYCLTNVISRPEHAPMLAELKAGLEAELTRFDDPILARYRNTGPIPADWLTADAPPHSDPPH
jgi:arylsulfatase A-like enzyme